MNKGETQIEAVLPGILRLRAANPSALTGTGTNTYVLTGAQGAVVIDPGPDLDAHLAAILAALGDRPLQSILLTHAHLDHSALCPRLAAQTSAKTYAFGPAVAGRSAVMQRLAAEGLAGGGEGIDPTFSPDVSVADGEVLELAGLAIKALHTPGHIGSHLCFGLGPLLFSGDHVMEWSTTLVSPPDGDMGAYMASLQRLSGELWQVFLPGHGGLVPDPAARLQELIVHRRAREASILSELREGAKTPAELALCIYAASTPAALLPAAARNILAHLIDLNDRNVVGTLGKLGSETKFHLI